jgi:hypothetical protein
VKLEEVDGYAEAKATYDGSVTAAKAASDELGELKAELAWRTKMDGFRDQVTKHEAHSAALDAARAEVKSKFTRAPEAVYAHLTDPAAILQVAQQVHEQIEAAMPPVPPNGRPPSQPWPSAPTGGAAPQPGHKFDDVTQWNEAMGNQRYAAGRTGLGMNDPKYKEMFDFVVERTLSGSPNKR